MFNIAKDAKKASYTINFSNSFEMFVSRNSTSKVNPSFILKYQWAQKTLGL